MKRYILIILLLFSFALPASADSVGFYYEYGINDEVNYLRLNGNTRNILTWANGGIDNINLKDGFRMVEILGTLPLAEVPGRVVYLTTEDILYLDDGTNWWGTPTYQGTPAQGEMLYFNGTNWVRLGTGSIGNTLKSGGSGANLSWASLNLAGGSAYVTGTLPIGSGGTGATANANAANGVCILDATGNVDTDLVDAGSIEANAIDSTHINTSFMGCFSKNVNEGTNTTIITGLFENKWIIYQGYFVAGTSGFRPGGVSDEKSLGEQSRVAGDDGGAVPKDSAPPTADLASDLGSSFNGRFYSESGITAPGAEDAYNNATPEGLCAKSADATNSFDTDCFLYVDATSEDIMLHIGTIEPQDTVDFSIFITVLPDTAL